MHTWKWKTWDIGWTHKGEIKTQNTVLLIHGFGANTNHWRFNHSVLAKQASTYAIDLLGFGRSDQPRSRLKDEPLTEDAVHYGLISGANRWLTSVQSTTTCSTGGKFHRWCRRLASSSNTGGTMQRSGVDRLRPAFDG